MLLSVRATEVTKKAFAVTGDNNSTNDWHRASQSMCPAPVFQESSTPFDVTHMVFRPTYEFPLLAHRPLRSNFFTTMQDRRIEDIELFSPTFCASATKLQEQKEESKLAHSSTSSDIQGPLRLHEIGPGGAHEVVQIKNLLPMSEIHRIFKSPESSASWLGNDILFLCVMGGQDLCGVFLSMIEVTVDTVDM